VTGERHLERLGALAAPGVREALAYARAAGRPITVDDAAAAMGCHRSVARRRLDRLEAAGLLAAEFRRPAGRGGPGAGRPAKIFQVPPEVDVLEYPPHRYAELVGLLLDEPARRAGGRPGEEGLQESDEQGRGRLEAIGRRFAAVLADGAAPGDGRTERVDAALEAVCALLGRLGYQAVVQEVTAEGGRLRVPTCPLRPVVIGAPSAADIDRGMWEGLLGLVSGGSAAFRCVVEGCLDPGRDCTVELRAAPGGRHSVWGGPRTSAP
jgi:predicted ArsR family transcriptional regulator